MATAVEQLVRRYGGRPFWWPGSGSPGSNWRLQNASLLLFLIPSLELAVWFIAITHTLCLAPRPT
ncbi:hypothetical protein ACFY03_23085 [Micromonospora chersina]|uniref:hypothetical protein n=1 Tax=Micromonospora chersina TaxID=47854 RepID=UPI00369CEDB5